jgi:3-methyladenine DNA glycosylase AlkD
VTQAAIKRLAQEIEAELRAAGGEERAVHEKGYLKSELKHLGTKVPVIRKVAKQRSKGLDTAAARELARVLWTQRVHERRVAAAEILISRVGELEPTDLKWIEVLIREAKTWAIVDNLAVKGAGRLAERFPKLHRSFDRWSRDEDFWIRRSALLAHLEPLRRGEGDFERFASYADRMLGEWEFFIRKAIGWVLRDTGRKRPELVYEWLLPRAGMASGVTMREAVRHLPEPMGAELMAAYRGE